MTAIELIELSQERISHELLSSACTHNIQRLEDAIKFLNEAKVLINEHQADLSVKNEESLTTT